MSLDKLISREAFTRALTTGIDVPHMDENGMFLFGERLITWINNAENDYWACWNPDVPDDILIDLKHYALLNAGLKPGTVQIKQSYPSVAKALPAEFGDAALGVILFCMMENNEVEQLSDVDSTTQAQEPDDHDDFEWI